MTTVNRHGTVCCSGWPQRWHVGLRVVALALGSAFLTEAHAQQTNNDALRAVPAPGTVALDG